VAADRALYESKTWSQPGSLPAEIEVDEDIYGHHPQEELMEQSSTVDH
jgi:hypothetical protein